MKLYIIAKDDRLEQTCLVGTAKEAAEYLNLTMWAFYSAASRPSQSHRGYKIYKMETDA